MNNQILNNCLNYINTLSIIDINNTKITNKGIEYLNKFNNLKIYM